MLAENDKENYISDLRCVNGNFITCCRRMVNGVSKYTSTVTGESYKIDGYYTCETNNCIYLVTCEICDEQYVGKTTTSMRKRHGFHQSDIRANRNGLGSHIFKHAEEMGINMRSNMEEIMTHLQIIIITSADKYSKEEWKDMEADIMQTLQTTEEYGGMNMILERKHNQKQYKCKQCDFKANGTNHIWQHKRRTHSYYMLLCDHCGYTSNDKSHFRKHFRRMHPEYVL